MRKLIAALAVVLLEACASNKAFAQEGSWWWCMLLSNKTHNLSYFSDTFGPAQALRTRNGDTLTIWIAQFTDYIFKTYGDKSVAGCRGHFTSASAAEASRKEAEQQLGNPQYNGKVINTGWQPSPLQPVQ